MLRVIRGGEEGEATRGDIVVVIRGGTLRGQGIFSHVVDVSHDHVSAGDIYIVLEDVHIRSLGTEGNPGTPGLPFNLPVGSRFSQGVLGLNRGDGGHISIEMRGGSIVTEGLNSHGLRAFHQIDDPAAGGTIWVRISGGAEIVTRGRLAHGVNLIHESTDRGGDTSIQLDDATIRTESTELDPDPTYADTWSHGIVIYQENAGNILVDLRRSTIETEGVNSYGIYARHSLEDRTEFEGDIDILLRDSAIRTAGAGAHAILAEHRGTLDGRTIRIAVEGGSVVAAGEDAIGIRVGRVETNGAVKRAAGLDDDGYRRQTVRVNGRVQGGTGSDAAGIFLAGGGRVIVGPNGRVGARSGIAIHADGNNFVDGQPVSRKLLVHLLPDGRPLSGFFDGIVRNDGGETVLMVNGTVLYDSTTGATDLWASNGARDIRLADGFTGLDFSSADSFIGRFAPRAAVYEALPGAVMRLHGRSVPDGGDRKIRSGDSPLWVRVAGGAGGYEAESSTVGAGYDFKRVGLEAGIDFPLGSGLSGSIGWRHVSGSADVAAPTGGGRIAAEGHGLPLGLSWQGENGWHGEGSLSLTRFDLNAVSASRGGLTRGLGASASTLGIGVGRRLAIGQATVTPRVWLRGVRVSADSFTDAVGARVSLDERPRFDGGMGGVVETALVRNGGAERLTLRGSLNLEYALSGSRTSVTVGNERLKSKAVPVRPHVGLGASWRHRRYFVDGAIRMSGLGTGDTAWTGRLHLRVAF